MDNSTFRKMLLDKVVEQIKKDINDKDETAIHELLQFLPKERLEAYLPEN